MANGNEAGVGQVAHRWGRVNKGRQDKNRNVLVHVSEGQLGESKSIRRAPFAVIRDIPKDPKSRGIRLIWEIQVTMLQDFKTDKKKIVIVFVALVVAIVGSFLLLRNGPDSVPVEPRIEITGEMRIEGVVLDVDTSEMPIDGDGIATIQTPDGQDVTILVPAGEILKHFTNLS